MSRQQDNARRRQLEKLSDRGAKLMGQMLTGTDALFAVLIFSQGEGGFAAYTSNAHRDDMIRALREQATHLEGSGSHKVDEGRDSFDMSLGLVTRMARDMDTKLRAHVDKESHRAKLRAETLPADEPWQIAMSSYMDGRKKFDEWADKLAGLDENAEVTTDDAAATVAAWAASLVQMAASLLLAVSYAPGMAGLPIEVRGSDEIH